MLGDNENKNIRNEVVDTEAEVIDDVFDDIYIPEFEKNKEESNHINIEIASEKNKNCDPIKNINLGYKEIYCSNDVILNHEPIINISNLSINQNNYNPIFNTFRSENLKENEIQITHDISKDSGEEVFEKFSAETFWNKIAKYKYLYLAVLIIILIILLITFFIY